MKRKKDKMPKFRIPLPKQRNQAFKDKTKYDRKRKDNRNNDCPSFVLL